jgi:hypothetical protein
MARRPSWPARPRRRGSRGCPACLRRRTTRAGRLRPHKRARHAGTRAECRIEQLIRRSESGDRHDANDQPTGAEAADRHATAERIGTRWAGRTDWRGFHKAFPHDRRFIRTKVLLSPEKRILSTVEMLWRRMQPHRGSLTSASAGS